MRLQFSPSRIKYLLNEIVDNIGNAQKFCKDGDQIISSPERDLFLTHLGEFMFWGISCDITFEPARETKSYIVNSEHYNRFAYILKQGLREHNFFYHPYKERDFSYFKNEKEEFIMGWTELPNTIKWLGLFAIDCVQASHLRFILLVWRGLKVQETEFGSLYEKLMEEKGCTRIEVGPRD